MSKLTLRLVAALSGAVLAVAGALALAGSPASAATTAHCERYVFYPSGQSLCDKFPGNTDRDCDDIKFKVALLGATVDPWHLDGSGQSKGNGMGCETKPDCPNPYPTATQTSTPTTAPTTTPATTQPTTPATTTPPTTEPTDEPTTATASPSQTEATAAAGESLPLTGPGAPMFLAVAAVLLLTGTGVLVWVRRRRATRFAA